VSPEEVQLAETRSSAKQVLAFGEPGFGLQLDSMSPLVESIRLLPEVRVAARVGTAGIDQRILAWDEGPEFLCFEHELDVASRVKDDDEVAKIRHAYDLCWRGQSAVSEAAERGASEIEMFTAAQATAQVGHGTPIDFVADLLVGERTADVCCPVAVAGSRRPAGGDWVVADIALGADGYWGDTCRTHLTPSTPRHVIDATAELERIRDVLADRLRPGAVAAELHEEMRQALLGSFPGATFPHHGGHGIGLTGFEYPHVIPGDESILERGMILALEPGVYFRGQWGARVEQLFQVTDGGGIELNQVTLS
jgi:Xaa-Pro dipeptidase